MEVSVVFFSAVAVLLSVVLVVLRIYNSGVRRRYDELTKQWNKLFRTVFYAPVDDLPPVDKDDLFTVTLIWNSVRQLRESDYEQRNLYIPTLNKYGKMIALDDYAVGLLEKGDDADKIVALTTLGFLGDQRALQGSRVYLTAPGTELSRAAAHALLRLDPAGTIDAVLLQVARRDDWVPTRVEQMLREIGTAILDPAMKRVIRTVDDRGKDQLLENTNCCSKEAARAIALDALRASSSREVIATALKALAPVAKLDDAAVARKHASDEAPFVRLAALRILRNLATLDDSPLLEKLVADRDYWVRHRAAETLVALNHGNSKAVVMAEQHPDSYARAALAQAIAEYKLGADREILAERRGVAASASGARV